MENDRTVYRHNGEFVTRVIGGEILLVPIRGPLAAPQKIFVLNPVAEFILSQIDGVRSLREIRAAVRDRFEAAAETIDGDVADFLSELRAEDLVVERKTSGNAHGHLHADR